MRKLRALALLPVALSGGVTLVTTTMNAKPANAGCSGTSC
jgi:hypothetical protein